MTPYTANPYANQYTMGVDLRMMGVDVRVVAQRTPVVPTLFAAPHLGVDIRAAAFAPPTPELFAAPRIPAMRTSSPWGQPPAQTGASWGWAETAAGGCPHPAGLVLGDHGRALFGADPEPSTLGQLYAWWNSFASNLHRAMFQQVGQFVTGMSIPAEVAAPALVAPYLADALKSQGELNKWDLAWTASHEAAIRRVATLSSVVDTITRIISMGPPKEWPGADSWYQLAYEMRRSASLLSAGERAGYVTSATSETIDAAKQGIVSAAPPIIESIKTASYRALEFAENVVPEGLRTAQEGFKFSTAALVVGGVLTLGLGVAVIGAWFAPEIATAATAVGFAGAASGGRRKD